MSAPCPALNWKTIRSREYCRLGKAGWLRPIGVSANGAGLEGDGGRVVTGAGRAARQWLGGGRLYDWRGCAGRERLDSRVLGLEFGGPEFRFAKPVVIFYNGRTFKAPAMAGLDDGPWGCSSAGRARRSQCRGQGFEPPHLHHAQYTYQKKPSAAFFVGISVCCSVGGETDGSWKGHAMGREKVATVSPVYSH